MQNKTFGWESIKFYVLLISFSESIAKNSKIYSYGKNFNGFAARLLPHEVKRLSGIYIYIYKYIYTADRGYQYLSKCNPALDTSCAAQVICNILHLMQMKIV
jgi:hypothetical protein